MHQRRFKSSANLFNHLKKIILSQEFREQHRRSIKDFGRSRKLPFHLVVIFFLNFIKGSYQDELDNFFKALLGFDVAKRMASKAALCKARLKLKFEAFIELNKHLTEFYYKNFIPKSWFGHRLVVFDASTVRLPHIEKIVDYFGTWGSTQGDPRPMARVSQMFDPLNKISIDAIISPKSTGERDLAVKHCQLLQPNDILLLDRGYPAFWLFKLILSRGANFCARVQCQKWKVVKEFYHSGAKEKIFNLPLPYASIKKCKELDLDTKPIMLRLVRVELNHGETEILLTSLTDKQLYMHDVFMQLYHQRWPVEEDYKTMKCWIEVENFSGKSVLAISQDFYAKILSKNLTSILASPARESLEQGGKNRKYIYQINFAQALSKTKNVMVLMFQRKKRGITKLITNLHDIYVQTIEPIRPGRKYPRNHKFYLRNFFINYKPIC